MLAEIRSKLPSNPESSTTGFRMFPNKSKDIKIGWRVDFKGVHEDREGWLLTLELQPNRDAKLRGLRERARGLHTVLGLLRVRLDDQKKIPAGLDVTGLLATIVGRKEARDIDNAMKREGRTGKMKRVWKKMGANATRDAKVRVILLFLRIVYCMLICFG